MLSSLLLLSVAPLQANQFSEPFNVAEPTRLAITPTLDGTISEEEWDPIASGPNWLGAFQWEPRKFHIGGKFPVGQDLVVSIDRQNNGWLAGKDNLEVRFSWQGGKVVVAARTVDATRREGPQFVEEKGFELASTAVGSSTGATGTVASNEGIITEEDGSVTINLVDAEAVPASGGSWVLEATLEDPNVNFFPRDRDRVGIRYDLVPAGQPINEAYLPRAMTTVRLAFDRDQALPVGLRFNPETRGRVILPGANTQMRFTFQGTNSIGIRNLSLRAEGPIQEQMSRMTVPFPFFDNKGRAFVDYPSRVLRDVTPGYRVMRGEIGLAEGPPAITQTSFLIAPILEFEIPEVPVPVKGKPLNKRFPLYIKSFANGRVDGTYRVRVPDDWQLAREDLDQTVVIYASRGRIRKILEVTLPPNTSGTFPIDVEATIGKEKLAQRLWVTIRE